MTSRRRSLMPKARKTRLLMLKISLLRRKSCCRTMSIYLSRRREKWRSSLRRMISCIGILRSNHLHWTPSRRNMPWRDLLWRKRWGRRFWSWLKKLANETLKSLKIRSNLSLDKLKFFVTLFFIVD